MARMNIDDIRDKICNRKYDLTVHAVEEMAEDGLLISNNQSCTVGFRELKRTIPEDRNIIEGPAIEEQILVGSVGRFVDDRYLVITIYAITSSEN